MRAPLSHARPPARPLAPPTHPHARSEPTRRVARRTPATLLLPPHAASGLREERHAATPEEVVEDAEAAVVAREAAAAAAPFKWTANWWPVLCVSGATAADAGRPHAVQVLGLDLVAWRDDGGTWRVARDACPHRLAPLSEGRVDPNPRAGGERQLLCSYHGWAWDGCGTCARIPQSEHDPAALSTALASPRTRLLMYPTTVAAGLLFVWPEADAGAAERATAAPPPPVPTEVVDAVTAKGWYVRDTLYPYEILLENLTDPAHLPVSHHGLGGLRRANAKPVPQVRRPPSPDDPGATVDFNIASVMAPPDVLDTSSRLTFYAPSHVRYRYKAGPTRIASTCLYATPTAPGRSRVFLVDAGYTVPAPAADDTAAAAGVQSVRKVTWAMRLAMLRMVVLFRVLPPYFAHFSQSFIFDSDGILLFGQAERLAAAAAAAGADPVASATPWAKSYYLVSSDNFVATLRAWLDRVGGGRPAYAPGAPPPPTRPLSPRIALDRDAQHTALCSLCQRGRAQVTAARNVLAAVAGGAALAAAAAVGRAATRPVVIAVVVALLAAAAAAGLHRGVLPQFGYVGHVHADHD